MRRLALIATAAALCAGLAGFAAMADSAGPPAPRSAPGSGDSGRGGSQTIGSAITTLQAGLRRQPTDASGWAQLGSACVERARLTVDPTLYPKSEAALRRSLTLQPRHNTPALTGMAELANARHRFAQAEWTRRHSVLVADALGWALHRAGRDAEALPMARQADRPGWRDALLHYHRGVIEQSLGDDRSARADLTRALTDNPRFSPLLAPDARTRPTRLQGMR